MKDLDDVVVIITNITSEWVKVARDQRRKLHVGWMTVVDNVSGAIRTCSNNSCTVSTHALRRKICSESTNLRRSGGFGFRTLDSRIRSMIRIVTKILSLGPWAMPYPSKKFHHNPFTSLWVIRRTARQTDRQTNRPNQKRNLLLRRR